MGRDSARSPRALGPLLARWQSTLGNSLGNPHIIQHHLSEMIGPTVQSCKAHWNISKEHLETFILQFLNTPIPAVLKEQSIFLIQQLKKNVVVLVFPIYFFTKLSMEVWQVSINIFHISHKTHFSIINILSRYKYAKHALHKKLNDP